MPHTQHTFRWRPFLLSGCFLLALLLAACGGSSATGTGTSSAPANLPASGRSLASNGSNSTAGTTKQLKASADTQQYLIKTLKVGMNVKDTRKVADDLQSWISTTDPRSFSTGADYEQAGNNQYNITLSFSVQASIYPRIALYLRNYPAQHDGQLTSNVETVQDVTNDYIDTNSRLQNLRGEQTRLLDLMSHATALGDIISIEQRLTDVEGQIENIEAHLKSLTGQVTFYTITISLQPLDVATQPEQPAVWSIGQTVHDAFAASLGFAQALITFLVWLLAFSVYLIPLALVTWFVIRWRARRLIAPKSATFSLPEQ